MPTGRLAHKEFRGYEELPDRREPMEPLARKDRWGLSGQQVLTEQPARKEFRGFKERQGQEERLAPPVLPGRPERMEPLARKEFKAYKGLQVQRV